MRTREHKVLSGCTSMGETYPGSISASLGSRCHDLINNPDIGLSLQPPESRRRALKTRHHPSGRRVGHLDVTAGVHDRVGDHLDHDHLVGVRETFQAVPTSSSRTSRRAARSWTDEQAQFPRRPSPYLPGRVLLDCEAQLGKGMTAARLKP